MNWGGGGGGGGGGWVEEVLYLPLASFIPYSSQVMQSYCVSCNMVKILHFIE